MFCPRKNQRQQRSPCPSGENMKGDFSGGSGSSTAYFSGGMAAPFGANQHFPQMGNGYVLGGGAAPQHSCFGGRGRMQTRSFHTGRGCHGWQRGSGGGPSPAAMPNYQPPNPPHVPLVNGTVASSMGMYPPQLQPLYEFVPIPMTWVACEAPVAIAKPPPKGYVPPLPPNNNRGSTYDVNPQGFINGIKKLVNGFMNPNLNCDFYSDHTRHYNPKYRNNYVKDQRRTEQLYSASPRPPNTRNYYTNCNAMKTEIVKLDSEGSSSAGSSATIASTTDKNHAGSGPLATFEFTIFTNDDFPALPAVKKHRTPPPPMCTSGVSKVADKLPRARRKPRHGKSPSPARRHQSQQKHEKLAKKQTGASVAGPVAAALTPETDITCKDFVVLPKPKINHAINVPVRPVVDASDRPTPTTATSSNQCQSPAPGDIAQFLWQRSPRIRQISECSDDSFVICFSEDAQEGVLEVARDSDDDDDSDSDLESGSETETSSDEDYDETDNHHHRRIADLSGQFDSGFDDEKKDKKVRFNLKPQVHVMYAWNYAYRAARKGHWENFARDRDRFKKRINNVSVALNPILDTQHRETIYKSRFQCDSKDDDINGAIVTNPPDKSNTRRPPQTASTVADESARTRLQSAEETQ